MAVFTVFDLKQLEVSRSEMATSECPPQDFAIGFHWCDNWTQLRPSLIRFRLPGINWKLPIYHSLHGILTFVWYVLL